MTSGIEVLNIPSFILLMQVLVANISTVDRHSNGIKIYNGNYSPISSILFKINQGTTADSVNPSSTGSTDVHWVLSASSQWHRQSASRDCFASVTDR